MPNKELSPDFIREELQKEHIVTLDLEYVSNLVEQWWINKNSGQSNHLLKLQLIALLLNKLKPEHIKLLGMIGLNYISAICITNIFRTDNYILALLVHEAMCELFHLNDIQYEYEDHKALYLKPGGENYRDWGNGYGEITPHSDDLYEDTPTDLLALTVCRDSTKTPTSCYFPKDIFANFSDDEITQISKIKVKFISGKNISIVKQKERNIIEYDSVHGLQIYMDFRIDNHTGERMVALDTQDQNLVDKLRAQVTKCTPIYSVPETGTFFIVANYKVLHARAVMNMSQKNARVIASNPDFGATPRLLYRSKGRRYRVALEHTAIH